ncbi:adenosylcobinamide-GDP ribazoletransferase [Natronosporangium hydrolyticum]|uniref:Adenosylcobinamide-GDP ribazoletransferase n=1 Tax=Natronosporangium hydrolyticum TaxID=2811111 RepID=A0A895Y5V2_9ACTN|nr:adenosylcobinamide-GDP ribazoletransferase [Natronosporangium hydrolyticum]QSB12771.1 adenosylcobinamide-GDP ribazoletransferase [Natronosporangium hydrolyticum]
MRDALGFLTVLPVRAGPLTARAVALFPVVGALIGATWVAAGWLGYQLGGPLVAAALVLAVDLVITGALHLDGLADTADGLAAHRPPDQVREVMKDPRIGAVGAAALTTTLLLRFALLAALVEALTSPVGWLALATVPVVGRCGLVLLLAAARPRRDSLAAGPVAAVRGASVVAAAGLTVLLVLLGAGGWALFAAAAALLAAVTVVRRWWWRRLGAAGDTIGAGGLLTELLMLGGLLGVVALGGSLW